MIWPIWSLDSKIELTNGIKNGCDQSCYWTLKLTVSEEWTDGINWFFACQYRFTKIKSWSKHFWVGIVKNGCGQSDHRTLKLSVSSILVFCMLVQIQESQKLTRWFLGGPVQRWHWSFTSRDSKVCCILMNV